MCLGGRDAVRVSQSLSLPVQHEIIHGIIFILKINSPKGPGCAVPLEGIVHFEVLALWRWFETRMHPIPVSLEIKVARPA